MVLPVRSPLLGQGLAYEACQRVLNRWADDERLRPIMAETQERNAPARRLLRRLGFQEVTRLHRFGANQVVFFHTIRTRAAIDLRSKAVAPTCPPVLHTP
ncbi:GNAT family N-acetyltransferase [Synechococcus sp. MU1644]|nr:GNAT family N-acetyltransferase [Synechococcus sp. MU1644]